jgi:thymidylate synthase
MKQYQDMLRMIMGGGVDQGNRTGVATRSIFGHQMRFRLREGFPLVTTKFTPMKLIATELLWFLKGNPDISYLHEHNNHIWDEWVQEDGTFGPIYGKQWRSWVARDYQFAGEGAGIVAVRREIDQIAEVIRALKENPQDRRMIVTAWNPGELKDMALPPCHLLFQFYSNEICTGGRAEVAAERNYDVPWMWADARNDEEADLMMDEWNIPRRALSCQLYQRSCDTFLGVPFNIASYALLTHMVAQVTGHIARDFVWTGGDVHIYHNHFDQVTELLAREPKELPRLSLNEAIKDIDAFTPDDIRVLGYEHHPKIKAAVAV